MKSPARCSQLSGAPAAALAASSESVTWRCVYAALPGGQSSQRLAPRSRRFHAGPWYLHWLQRGNSRTRENRTGGLSPSCTSPARSALAHRAPAALLRSQLRACPHPPNLAEELERSLAMYEQCLPRYEHVYGAEMLIDRVTLERHERGGRMRIRRYPTSMEHYYHEEARERGVDCAGLDLTGMVARLELGCEL